MLVRALGQALLNRDLQAVPSFSAGIPTDTLTGLGGTVRTETAPGTSVSVTPIAKRNRRPIFGLVFEMARIHATQSHIADIFNPVSSGPCLGSALVLSAFCSQLPTETWLEPTASTRSPLSRKLPYPALIKALIELEEIGAARTLVTAALREGDADPYTLRLRDLLSPPVAMRSPERDVDRTREYRWLRARGAEHRGYWVALDGDTLVARAVSLKELLRNLKGLRLLKRPLVHRVE
jgi:hypothetical protein